jgi:trans-aconitate 2-methyltransferase
MSVVWNSAQYLKFKNERTQPAIDLVNRIRINHHPQKIIDIGCGPGNSTKVLSQRFPNTYILGVDSSPDMIETAKRDYPCFDFKICDISKDSSMLDTDFDIVFSNACIQWIPNHEQLLYNLVGLLKPSGILAVQIPMNYQQPIHKIIHEVLKNIEYRSEFPNPEVFYNLTQSQYFDLLSDISLNFSIWETVYFHNLKSHKDIIEWYRGSGLRPYLNVLSNKKKAAFEQDILQRIIQEYPPRKNGNIIFKFPRLFFTLEKIPK